jgi:hypothetical protein
LALGRQLTEHSEHFELALQIGEGYICPAHGPGESRGDDDAQPEAAADGEKLATAGPVDAQTALDAAREAMERAKAALGEPEETSDKDAAASDTSSKPYGDVEYLILSHRSSQPTAQRGRYASPATAGCTTSSRSPVDLTHQAVPLSPTHDRGATIK